MATSHKDALGTITETILRESPFGDVTVHSVIVTEGTGPDDEPYLHFTVTAEDPDPKAGTWSRESVFALRRRVRELAAEAPEELPMILVDVHPATEDDLADDDDAAADDAALAEDLDNADG